MNQPWEVSKPKQGMIPIEFGIDSMPEIMFSENGASITIYGDKHGGFASGVHFGNKIR